jgi:aldehyde dehydrogenase (NAD+)
VTTIVGDVPSAGAESEPHADRRLLIDGRLVGTDRFFASINPAPGVA